MLKDRVLCRLTTKKIYAAKAMAGKRSRSQTAKMPSEERDAGGAGSEHNVTTRPFLEPTVDTEASSRGSARNAWDEDMTEQDDAGAVADKKVLLCDDMGIPQACKDGGLGAPGFYSAWHHSFVEIRFDMEDKIHLLDTERHELHLCHNNQNKRDALKSHCGRYWWGGDEKRSVWSFSSGGYIEVPIPVFVRDQCPTPTEREESADSWDPDGKARMLIWHAGRWHICVPGFGSRPTEWILAISYSNELSPPIKAFDFPHKFERWRNDEAEIPLRVFTQDHFETAMSRGLEQEAADMLQEIGNLRGQVTELEWYKQQWEKKEAAKQEAPRGGWQIRACALLGAWIADEPQRFKHLVNVQLGPVIF